MSKLKNLYISSLYKLSTWGANIVNKAMLHLIEINGLDPNSDPKQLEHLRFKENLEQAVDPRRFESGSKRAYAKISVPINPGSKHDMPHDKAYKVKSTYPKGGVVDFSNCADSPEVDSEEYLMWKKLPKRPMTPSEVMVAHSEYVKKTYEPATNSRQPPMIVATHLGTPAPADLEAACDNFQEICESLVTQPSITPLNKDAINKSTTNTEKITDLMNAYSVADLQVFAALDNAIKNNEGEEVINHLKKTTTDIFDKQTKKTMELSGNKKKAKLKKLPGQVKKKAKR